MLCETTRRIGRTILHAAPNHRENWALVQLIDLSTDEQLTAWLTGSVA